MFPTAPVAFPPFPSQVGSGALSPHFVFVSWKLRDTLIGKGPVSNSGLQTGQLLWRLIFLAINVYIESLNPGHLQHGSCIRTLLGSYTSHLSCTLLLGRACLPSGEMFVSEA